MVVKEDILKDIRSSDRYESIMEDLNTRYDNVEERSTYMYQPSNFDSDVFLVVVKLSGISDIGMDLLFMVNEDGEVIDAEAKVDTFSSKGTPQKTDEYLEAEPTLKEKVESFRQD